MSRFIIMFIYTYTHTHTLNSMNIDRFTSDVSSPFSSFSAFVCLMCLCKMQTIHQRNDRMNGTRLCGFGWVWFVLLCRISSPSEEELTTLAVFAIFSNWPFARMNRPAFLLLLLLSLMNSHILRRINFKFIASIAPIAKGKSQSNVSLAL